ncbi:hypothetical protein [Kineosporia succinea]|uniref:Uncharacterized protein n=1 Tax=Kineosporia succinea TaxID=84632 RepID=A0ABT9P8I6_9ACTN|nr:hypothetical protein [Kineosporia succinea]MDP9829012.1 hypothetical protein [Kineosporia succinea]
MKFGGIPGDKVARIRILAQRDGTPDDAFTGWLTRQSVLPTAGDDAIAWNASIRRQIRVQILDPDTERLRFEH